MLPYRYMYKHDFYHSLKYINNLVKLIKNEKNQNAINQSNSKESLSLS